MENKTPELTKESDGMRPQIKSAEITDGTYEKLEITAETREIPAKKKEKTRNMLLRVILSIVLIAVGIFVILWAVAKASLYDSIGAMLRHMWTEFGLMWSRITA